MKIYTKLFLFLSIFSILGLNSLILAPKQTANAGGFLNVDSQEGLSAIAGEFGQKNKPKDVREIAIDLVRIVLGLLGTIFLVLIIVGGYKYMVSAGNDDQIKDAKNQIMQAAIGLIIILVAFSITVFITREVSDAATGYTTLF